ncbi:MAG TPA: hypothetical protein VFE98_10955 [Candidatus Bathyarchaeia archaeon]|nr:hypothetical protein [Candidatus Bathyarchaeia archaeon]
MKRSKTSLLLGTFPEIKLPSRSRPGEYFDEFRAVVKKIPPRHVVEIDANKVTEHRARRYLGMLALQDPRYRSFRVRTTGGDVRRRVFITNGNETGRAIEAPQPVTSAQRSDGEIRP